MDLSQDDIKLIVKLVSEKLGPHAGIEEIKSMAAEVIERFSANSSSIQVSQVAPHYTPRKRLIVNALGPNCIGLEEQLRLFTDGKLLQVSEISSMTAQNLRCVLAIIDYSQFRGDINQIKFELSKICENSGFKALIQDSSYYGV